jgi:hypothetical protein
MEVAVDVSKLAIGGVALLPLIIGLVEFSKRLGLKGNWLIGEAFVLGTAFAGVWGALQQGLMPAPATPWITVGVMALGGGVAAFAAVGNYDLAKRLFARASKADRKSD